MSAANFRYAVLVEYDGTNLVGWQRQKNGIGVQEVIESALNNLTGSTVAIQAAGRTDAGVHASGQVAHFDLNKQWPTRRLIEGLNYHLRPFAIAIIDCRAVSGDFSARFSAVQRQYFYHILTRTAPAVLQAGQVWWLPRPLALEPMQQAAALLVGRHDFTSFRAAQCQARSPVKSLSELSLSSISLEGGLETRITITARAPSFLHHQVRNMVGSLVQVGLGRWPVERMAEALAARDRSRAGETAPPQGLVLARVWYPELDFYERSDASLT
ncbi:MAG: tRNA pseudouridine(38-40) synthase TruA [Candidatus Pacebacteria bacterium]|nr:tRNA pseudouridine(38-40) synthase TruA [Candidatus Paceibacterota bacterium]